MDADEIQRSRDRQQATRQQVISSLQQLATLLSGDATITTPGVEAGFFPRGEHAPAAIASIMAAVPLPWETADPDDDGKWHIIRGTAGDIAQGFRVTIFADPADVPALTNAAQLPLNQDERGGSSYDG